MILFFHFICLLARYIASNISKSISKTKLILTDDDETESTRSQSSDFLQNKRGHLKKPVYEDGTLKFFPPVYVQRYETVAIILQDSTLKGKIRKVADFGCAELGFFMYLKNMEGVNEVLEIDIDAEILERSAFKAAPLTADYVKCKENKPLDVYILSGSIADYDDCLIGTDVVIGIELIEHLTEEAFQKMPYNVFYNIKPKLVIFTTPNADFNTLFPNFRGVRDVGHRFEWTRKQFFDWTQSIIKQYPEYFVRFYGIGAGPEGTENLGCCSQMAVFQRHGDSEAFLSAREELSGIQNYQLIKHYKYPVYVDTRTREEKIINEIQYQVFNINALPTYYNSEDNESEIPLSLLKEYVADLCTDFDEFRNILKNNGMKLRERNDTWYLVYQESEYNSSEESAGEEWTNGETNLGCNGETSFDENWDWKEDQLPAEESTNFESARSLHALECNTIGKQELEVDMNKSSTPQAKETAKSVSESCNQLRRKLGPPKSLCSSDKIKSQEGKSKIPRKILGGDNLSASSIKKTSLSNVCKPYGKISKSCSLDSCLENINFKPSESFHYNLIPSGSLSFRYGSPLSSDKSKRVINDSGSSLLSSSLEKAGDSGYAFSFSPPDADLTPEQVDELFSEISGSTSASSEEEIVDLVNRRLHHDLFLEDGVVENGDLANNNRDGEGNNVEGLPGQRLFNERDPNDNMMFFPEVEEFPPWLLNLGELARRPVFIPLPVDEDEDDDEGVAEDSSSDFN